jgi:Subtilase family
LSSSTYLSTPRRWRKLRTTHQLALTDFIPPTSYIERLSARRVTALREDPRVRAVARYLRQFKVSPFARKLPERKSDEDDNAPRAAQVFDAVLFADTNPKDVAADMIARGATVVNTLDDRAIGGGLTIRFELADVSRVEDVAELETVRWLEPLPETVDDGEPDPPRPVRSFHSLHGEGQILGIIDKGQPDLRHCFFRDAPGVQPGLGHRKVLQVRNAAGTASSQHATFTAGCAVGDDLNRPGTAPDRGIAWAAKLVTGNRLDLNTVSLLSELTKAGEAGARVHSNSYHSRPQGPGKPATYDERSRYVDAFTWANEDHLVIASSGNSGEEQGPPGTAKNALCVRCAAVVPADKVGDGNSGPTADGRRKPDLTAVGCHARSAINGTLCDTDELVVCASSFATPQAAAAAIIARQYFTEGFHPSGGRRPADALVPSGALLKAVLLNATIPRDRSRSYPNDAEGWGNLDLAKFLPLGAEARNLLILDVRNQDGLMTGQTRTQNVDVIVSDRTLKITLVWTEPPGASGSDDPVVNDLDLIVTAPGGAVFLGNVLVDGASVQGGESDRVNNTEMVLVRSAAAGRWQVKIAARRVVASSGPQGFALVVTGGLVAIQS